MDEREQYIAAMDDLAVDKRLGENIAKIVANEAAAEAEEREKTRVAETVRAEEKKAKKAKKGLSGWRGWQKALAGVFAFVICMTSAIGIGGGFADLGGRNHYTYTPVSTVKDVQTATAKGMIAFTTGFPAMFQRICAAMARVVVPSGRMVPSPKPCM